MSDRHEFTREAAAAFDAADPLGPCRDRFALPDGLIYLDGNSLGALPVNVAARVAEVVTREWGVDCIRSWNDNGWWDAPRRVGDRIGALIGAAPGQVMACDSTSVNLFKLAVAACRLRPDRRVVVTDAANFPGDLYVLASAVEQEGASLRVHRAGAGAGALAAELDDDVAAVILTHVDFRTGAMHDLAGVTAMAHTVGAVVLWDLAHSVGAVDLAVDAAGVDLAVGCGYKFLNGGPGAPAFAYVARRHQAALDQPITGWFGHVEPFAMPVGYQPAPGVARVLAGTPPILSMVALDAALDAFAGVTLAAVRTKSVALGELAIALVDHRLAAHGVGLVSPRAASGRGSQISLTHPDAYPIVQALIERGVLGDYREPGIIRFGLAPLYVGFVDVWDAVDRLAAVMASGEWRAARFAERRLVT